MTFHISIMELNIILALEKIIINFGVLQLEQEPNVWIVGVMKRHLFGKIVMRITV